MKYIKTYEEVNIDKPQVGDYVIIDYYRETMNINLKKFIENSIGKIISKRISVDQSRGRSKKKTRITDLFEIRFWYIPPSLKLYFDDKKRIILADEVKYWSKDKKELQTILQAKNYNL